MLAKLNILIRGQGVYFMDVNNTNRTTLVHCMNRALFDEVMHRSGADNQYLHRAIKTAEDSFHTVTMPSEQLYKVCMSSDPLTEGQKEDRQSLVEGVHPMNIGSMALKFDIQWALKEDRIIAKSMYDVAHHVAWYSYESTAGVSSERINKMLTGEQWPGIDGEIMDGLASPIFFDLFDREPQLLAVFAGFEANMRVRVFDAEPVPASRYLSDRPLKDIKDIPCQLGMHEGDALKLADNLGRAGLSTGTDLHNEIIRDIRGLLVNKIKQD